MGANPHAINGTAYQFLTVATRCFNEEREISPGITEVLIVPGIVCGAFAIELYLKSIITSEGGSIKGHDLAELLSSVSVDSQKAIRSKVSYPGIMFDFQLSRVAKAFEEWRYIYEQPPGVGANGGFLVDFAQACRKVAESLASSKSPPETS